MPFADIEIKFNKGTDQKYKKTEFITLGQGAHVIRILNAQAKTVPTHFFNSTRTSVKCLGDECPICANNKKLIMQFPENFREQASYNKVTYRFFVNVYDKTPAKVCGKCSKEYKDLRTTICTCGEVLPAAAPLNKVKVLSKGISLRDDLDSIERAMLDKDGNVIGLQNYDVILMVSGTGKDTKTTPVPRTDANEPVPEGIELFDLEKALIVLDPAEMLDAQRGVGLKDIFAARKAKADEFIPEEKIETIASQERLDEAAVAVDALFQ